MELPSYNPNWTPPARGGGAGAGPPAGTAGGENGRGDAGNEPGRARAGARGSGSASATERSPEEAQQTRQLKARDREVRMHEQAHLAAGGKYAQGGADFRFQRGPDGQLYAVGGEVQLDASKVPGDPEATLEKAETLARAALAPAEPSAQDLRVAAQARTMAAEARAELRQGGEEGERPSDGSLRIREEAAYREGATAGPPPSGSLLSQRV
jgi:hypothetical protein